MTLMIAQGNVKVPVFADPSVLGKIHTTNNIKIVGRFIFTIKKNIINSWLKMKEESVVKKYFFMFPREIMMGTTYLS